MKSLSQMILRWARRFADAWLQTGLRGCLLRLILLTTVFAAVAVWSVWPMPQQIRSQIPASRDGIATVPLFNAWTIAWNAHCAARGMEGYWDAPIFHPLKGTLALSEPQPATLMVAPAIWWLQSPALAYNVYMLLSLTLNGLFTVYLMRTLRAGWIASAVSGVAMIQHPLLLLQIEVLQLIPVWGILWTFAAVIRLRQAAVPSPTNSPVTLPENPKQPKSWPSRLILFRGGEAALAFVSVFAVAVHHGLFLTLLLATTGLLMVPWRHLKTWLPGAMLAFLIAAGLLVPLLLPIQRVMHEHAFERSTSLVSQLSLRPVDYLYGPETALIDCPLVTSTGNWRMSPGWIRVGLALLAMCVTIRPRNRFRMMEIWFLLAVAIVALLLSLGVNLKLGPWNVWLTLSQHVPGVSQVRSAFRFAYFVQIVVIVMAAIGVDCLAKFCLCALSRRRIAGAVDFVRNLYTMRHRDTQVTHVEDCRSSLDLRVETQSTDRIVRFISCVMLTTLVGLVMFELPPPAIRLTGVPTLRAMEWKFFVKSHLIEGHGVLMMPYVQGAIVGDFDVTTRWMVSTVLDDIPMINGYSGFFPESHFQVQKSINIGLKSEETLQLLYDAKIQFVIQKGPETQTYQSDPNLKFDLDTVFIGSDNTQVMELRLRTDF